MLKHIESNVETELDGWTVRHAAGSLRSAYAEVRQEQPLRTILATEYSCLCAVQTFACWRYCSMLSNKLLSRSFSGLLKTLRENYSPSRESIIS